MIILRIVWLIPLSSNLFEEDKKNSDFECNSNMVDIILNLGYLGLLGYLEWEKPNPCHNSL